MADLLAGTKDAEPDIFSFSFGAYSGKFVFGADQQIHLLSQQDIKITYNYENDFDKWLAVTPDGTKYYFGKTFGRDAKEYSTGNGSSNFAIQSTSWYLTRIESADAIYWIDFFYDTEANDEYSRMGHSLTVATQGSTNFTESTPKVTQTFSYTRRLTSIQTSTGKTTVTFVPASAVREDLTTSTTYALSRIDVTTGGICKKFVLNQDYFQGVYTPVYNDESFNTSTVDKKRLRLNSVQEMTCDGSLTVPPYVFTYNATTMPRRLSLARDMQGYYNGQDGNTGLLPSAVQTGSDYSNQILYPQVSGNRSIDETKMKAGILEKVQYPTGGFSEFTYEAHRLNPSATTLYGGLRIKKMIFKENATTQSIVKEYIYTQGTYFGQTGTYFRVNPVELKDQTTNPLPGNSCIGQGQTTYSSSSPKTLQGYHFGYTDMAILNLDGSKTEMNFSFGDFMSLQSFFYPYPPQIGVQDNVTNSFEIHRNAQGQIIKKVDYTYGTTNLGNVYAKKVGALSPKVIPTAPTTCNPFYVISDYSIKYVRKVLSYKIEETDGVSVRTDYKYNTANLHTQPIEIDVINGDGKKSVTKTYYAHDIDNTHLNYGIKQTFLNKNMVGIPLQVEVFTEGASGKVGSVVEYYDFGTTYKFYPYKYHSIHKDNTRDVEAEITYDSRGLPYSLKKKNFTPVTYFGFDGYDRLTTKTTYGSTTTLSSAFTYIGVSDLVASITDENGLIKKFTYDKLMRLDTLKDRMKSDDSDIQATTVFQYHYFNSPTDYNYVGTTTTFKGVTAPLSTKQYMDGLGRPIEVVKEGYTPSGYHQKNYVAYDVQGRQNKMYLPFEGTGLGFETPPPYTSSYVLTEYEASPLSRPIKQTNVDNTVVATSYGTNVANDVRLFVAAGGSGGSVSGGSYYAANTLYKTTMTDENAKQTCVFKDKLGRVILTRKFLGTQKVDTYNVYDDYGQLVAVLPPGSVDVNGAVTNSFTFQYVYDNQNRLSQKTVPGAEPQKFYYDNRDLLVLTQDGNMYAENTTKHLAILYDDLGRVVKTGFANVSPTQGQNFILTDAQITDKLTETKYYDNKMWVKHQGAKVLKPTGVSTNTDFVWSYIERRVGYEYTGNPIWTGKQHLLYPSVAQRPIDDNDTYGVDWSVSGYNGMQQPDLSIRYLFTGTSASEVRIRQDFEYDNGRRMTYTKYAYALNGAGLPSSATFNLSNMVYNYKDQLTEKNIGLNGTNALQSIDYTYNLRGWLTAINNVNTYGNNTPIMTPPMSGSGYIQNLAISPFIKQAVQKSLQTSEVTPPVMTDNNADLYSQAITYGSPDSRIGADNQYNGNISSTTWQVLGRDKQAYGFKYDDLDRLTESKYFDITDSYSNNQWNSNYSTDFKFNESSTYDVRGNILSLQRNGLNGGSWTSNGYTAATYGMIDNLVYNYVDSNRLKKVTETSLANRGFKYANSGNPRDFEYDKNGNLTADRNKSITNIEYNYLNLPQVITFTGNRIIQFVYDASGVKLRKIVNNNGTITTYDYVNGVEYKDNILQRIAHTEGSITRNEFGANEHQYILRDHLGNTRVTFRDGINKGDAYFDWNTYTYVDPNAGNTTGLNDGSITSSDIMQINNYYPFGLNMEGNWNGAKGDNKYQFNGKEWNDDFGLGWNHHDWRFLDVAINRFVTIDRQPEEEDQEQLSPYQFGYDNPIRYDDPDGQCPTCPVAAAGAVVGGLLGGLIEAGSQLYHDGGISNWSAVAGSATQGAITGGMAGLTMGASLATTVVVAGVANGIGGAANKAIQGKQITTGSVAKDVATGAALGAAGQVAGKLVSAGLNKLSNAAKGKLGEAVTKVKYGAQGYRSTQKAVVQTGGRTATGRIQVAKYDHAMKNVVTGKQLTVESKFNTSGLTSNQAAASSNVVTPGGLIIDRTTSEQLGNTAKAVVTGSSGQIKN